MMKTTSNADKPIQVRVFPQRLLTDYGKYGFRSKNDEKVNLEDEHMLGLTGPHAKAETNHCVIGAEREK